MRILNSLFKREDKTFSSVLIREIAFNDITETMQGEKILLETLSQDEYKGLTFLIVDDNTDQQNILGSILKTYGADVDFAENGQIGLQLYFADPNKYSIIFMDIQMPVMNGGEAAKRIRTSEAATARTIPIVALSGNMIANQGKELGFDFFLHKPFNIEQLAYAIRHIQKNAN